MENSLENKAKFFALYWGVNCISNDDFVWHGQETFETVLSTSKGDLSGWYATLKSLKDITDEDAVEVAKICEFTNQNSFTCKVFVENYFYNQYTIDRPYSFTHNVSQSIDLLRSKGYALPWMGLSIEQLIEYGWVKIQESEV